MNGHVDIFDKGVLFCCGPYSFLNQTKMQLRQKTDDKPTRFEVLTFVFNVTHIKKKAAGPGEERGTRNDQY